MFTPDDVIEIIGIPPSREILTEGTHHHRRVSLILHSPSTLLHCIWSEWKFFRTTLGLESRRRKFNYNYLSWDFRWFHSIHSPLSHLSLTRAKEKKLTRDRQRFSWSNSLRGEYGNRAWDTINDRKTHLIDKEEGNSGNDGSSSSGNHRHQEVHLGCCLLTLIHRPCVGVRVGYVNLSEKRWWFAHCVSFQRKLSRDTWHQRRPVVTASFPDKKPRMEYRSIRKISRFHMTFMTCFWCVVKTVDST
jgi:hypothetical protein